MKYLFLLWGILLFSLPSYAEQNVLKLSWWGKISVSFPYNTNNVSGLSLGMGSNTTTINGLQADILVSKAEQVRGIQTAFLGKAEQLAGIQANFVNVSYQDAVGMQVGFINRANEITGLQLGVINKATILKGLQLGIINIAENGWFPAMVLVNGRF